MEIFQTTKKNFKSRGIESDRTSFGLYEFVHILEYMLYISLLYVHIVYEAETGKQYTETILRIAMTAFQLFFYLTYKRNSQAVFKIIDDLEHGINKSE